MIYSWSHTHLQEASTCISEVLWDQLPMELLPVVLHRWQRLRLRSVPYVWPQGLETLVIIYRELSFMDLLILLEYFIHK